ncbi:hypothetical protein AQUCO_02800146v1 [Aquilegia coerulea]|uniref:Uncharacterized protein n=1 Tax=Aquilegia coerulea TaxID=218851 RepID=A0A2G5D425_AQUCA|nr:hypothetical protein AQUCO_02800146v1 [Aquilegia coerulea]
MQMLCGITNKGKTCLKRITQATQQFIRGFKNNKLISPTSFQKINIVFIQWLPKVRSFKLKTNGSSFLVPGYSGITAYKR